MATSCIETCINVLSEAGGMSHNAVFRHMNRMKADNRLQFNLHTGDFDLSVLTAAIAYSREITTIARNVLLSDRSCIVLED